MKTRKKIVIAGLALAVGLIGLTIVVLRGSPANYWITPGELNDIGKAGGDQLRVSGRVVVRSTNIDPATGRMTFKIKADGESEELSVAYVGLVPQAFSSSKVVIVEGSLGDREFAANRILIRCPENYMAENAAIGVSKVLGVEGALYR